VEGECRVVEGILASGVLGSHCAALLNCFMGPKLNGLSYSDSRIEIESCLAENCSYLLLGSESRCREFDSHNWYMTWRILRVFSGEYGFRTYSESFQGCFSVLWSC
jgi:hypothetical protein